jgi:glyoxylase-like metal-dependent hydrolase (beta-lactamase superfamily II)
MKIESARWARSLVLRTLVAAACVLMLPAVAGAQSPEQQVVNDAAAALGGRDKILGVKTLLLEGGGSTVGGTNLRWDDLGYASAINQLRDVRRAYDLANGRGRFEATSMAEYVFYIGDAPVRQIQGLDGLVAFNVGANGNPARIFGNQAIARRVEYLRHPLTLVRAALGPGAKLAKARNEGAERLVDITIDDLPALTLAISSSTKLPTRILQMTAGAMGDTLVTLALSDYRPANGLQLPSVMTSWTDKWPAGDILVHRTTVDGSVGDLAAPAAIAAATPPPAGAAPQPIPTAAREIAKGVWLVTGTTHHSIIVEYSDHLMVIEANNPERVAAVWAKARELRPNKPITTLLVTHHHGDHTAGVRDAVALGVTEIIAHESNLVYLNDMLKRPHTLNPDMLARQPNAKPVKMTTVGDTGVVKDGTMTVNLYHLLDNTHSDSNLLIYFPQGRILTQADVYMPRDARHIIAGEPLGHAPWNRNVLANIQYRKIQVDYHAPLHGDYVPHSKFLLDTMTMTQYQPGEEPKAETGARGSGGRGGEGGAQ